MADSDSVTLGGMNSDVFRTQADTRFNSFINPMNPMNQNPGNWGVNSAYLTPSYTAPYRPSYQGPYGTQYGSAPLPSWGHSARNVAGLDFANMNPAGNYYQQHAPFMDSFVNKPIDAGVSVTQNFVVPALATLGAYRYLNKPSVAAGRWAASSIMGGALRGAGVGAESAAAFAGGAGAVGGFVGGMMGPGLVAAGVVAAYNTVADPFVNQRQSANAWSRNFAGVNFGESGYGNHITGQGFSRSQAMSMGIHSANLGIKDNKFSMNETSDMLDMAGRAGLFDNVKASQFKSRAKDIISQTKILMEIGSSSDAQDAIEMMSKMQSAGVNVGSQLTKISSALKGHASAAGVDVQKMMNTVGMQGQYLYGANGITPYLGQMAAATSYSAFASAARNGTLSTASLARMGGVEGATQSSLTGQLNALSTPYAQMMGMNAMFGSGLSNNAVGNISRFGGMASGGPIQTLGAMGLYSGSIKSKLAERGPGFVQDMIMSMGKGIPGMVGKDGKMSAEKMYAFATQTGMMGSDEAKAFIAQMYSSQDSGVHEQTIAGFKSSRMDTMLKFRQNNSLDMGNGVFQDLWHGGIQAGQKIQGAGAYVTGGINKFGAKVGDSLEKEVYDFRFGEMDEGVLGGSTSTTTELNLGRLSKMSSIDSDVKSHLSKINSLAKSGNKSAIAYVEAVKAKDGAGKARELDALIRGGHIDADTDMDSMRKINSTAELAMTRESGAVADSNFVINAKLADRMRGTIHDAWDKYGMKNVNSNTGENVLMMGELQDMAASGKKADAAFFKKHKYNVDEVGAISLQKDLARGFGAAGMEHIADNALFKKYHYDKEEMYNALQKQAEAGGGELVNLVGGVEKAKSYKDASYAINDIVAASSKGKHLLKNFKVYGDMKTEDIEAYSKAQLANIREQEQTEKLYKSGKIDFTTYKNMQTESKNSDNISKFDMAVDGFVKAVEVFADKEIKVTTYGPDGKPVEPETSNWFWTKNSNK